MELTLTRQAAMQVLVICDGQRSHTFDLRTLIPSEKGLPQPLDDPVAYGKAIYQALFPPETAARRELEAMVERILLVTTDDAIDAIPWEYAYGPNGFLVLECHFVRGLPAEQRIAPPTLDTSLHIVAIPSNPLSHTLEPLNIDGEWMRLKEIIQELPYALTLERTRPATLERTGLLLTKQRQRVVHFMGHGGQDAKKGAILCFEKDNGDLDLATAKQFLLRVRGSVFLVTLNACVSATPGETYLSNLAAALVKQHTPYALGMRFSIPDEEAQTFSRTFYSYLARGSSVEEAVYQTRLALHKNASAWVIGVPVLYTSLSAPATGFAAVEGLPGIKESQPSLEVSALPRAEGAFQGRIEELLSLGEALTGNHRPRILTIHGGGGQGKTVLAREAVERFAWAWPGGVYATTLETLPERELFVSDLARFLGINTKEMLDPHELKRQVLARLNSRRMLLVLDNAETLVNAVEANNSMAIQLGQFLQQLPSGSVSLLVTAQVQLGWAGEVTYELGGLSPKEGASLFQQWAPQRIHEIDRVLAWNLSEKLDGHPLSLRLLGSAFNSSNLTLPTFIDELEAQLLKAENKYRGLDHRHRTLYASMETSVRYLDADLLTLLSKLWIFHAPFLPETAAAIIDPQTDQTQEKRSPVYDQLQTLWQRGLLTQGTLTTSDASLLYYRLLPSMRPFVEQYLAQQKERETLLERFGAEYSKLVSFLYNELDRGGMSASLALLLHEDLEQGAFCVTGVEQGFYLLHWGWILQRLGDRQHGLELIEKALDVAQLQQDDTLYLQVLNYLAGINETIGQPQRALELYEQALPLMREIGDRVGEGATLSGLASSYQTIGQPQRALELYEQALSIMREVGDRHKEAPILTNMAHVYQAIGQPQRALELYEQALPLMREVGNRAGEASTLDSMAFMYRAIGQPQRALELYEQALSIMREVGDRAGEASTLNDMARVYDAIGQPQRALELYEQVLPIRREVGDHPGEAITLNEIAWLYDVAGQPRRALELYEQALSIRREVGSRAGEAVTLNDMAGVYDTIGQPRRALELYEQALSIRREVDDRPGEAVTLNNMALVYQEIGRPHQALELYEQVLPIEREVGDRPGEAVTLNNMALVYQEIGQPRRALELYEQALTIRREIGDQPGEAVTFNNIAGVYDAVGQHQRALELYEKVLPLMREVGDRPGEATTLSNIAGVYQAIGQPRRALELDEQALSIRREVGDRSGEAVTLNNMALVYQEIGQPRRALELYEQALSIKREVGDRLGEATILGNIASTSQTIGQPQRALELYEQILPLMREVGDRPGEATTLSNMAFVHLAIGKPQRALELYQQVLPLMRDVGDRPGEATTLEGLANVYQTIGQSYLALELHQQVRSIRHEVGDRPGEASTLNNMAVVYQAIGQSHQALQLYEEALSIIREVGDRPGEASTLTNIAGVYQAIGQPERALELYKQALPLMREVNNRAGEAAILNGMAYNLMHLQQYDEALVTFEQSIQLERTINQPAGEIAGLVGAALLLYQYLNRPQEAILQIEQAIAVLQTTDLPQDAAGHTVEDLESLLQIMKTGNALDEQAGIYSPIPTVTIQKIVSNTIAYMTIMQDQRLEWREVVAETLLEAQQRGANWQIDADFFTAVLAILDGISPNLPADNPYAQAIAAIQSGIAAGGPSINKVSEELLQAICEFVNTEDLEMKRQVVETKHALLFQPEVEVIFEENIQLAEATEEKQEVKLLEQHLAILRNCKQRGIAETFEQLEEMGVNGLPFDAELLSRSISALLGGPQEKMAHTQYLTTLAASTTDEELKALINTIQLALFGSNLSELGQNLRGIYRQAWEAIVAGFEAEGIDPRLFDILVRNTLAMLGPSQEQRDQWREHLMQIKGQAAAQGVEQLIKLLEAIIGLLDAQGDPAGLGSDLSGIYARTWQTIVASSPNTT